MSDEQSRSLPDLQALHLHLQDLLAGYADGELTAEEQRLVEAHLAGCEACRQDLARQRLLHQRLVRIPPPPVELAGELSRRRPRLRDRLVRRWWKPPARGAWAQAGWLVSAVLLIILLVFPPGQGQLPAEVPMVQDALAEYLHASRIRLPSPLPEKPGTAPLLWPGSRVIAQWQSRVGGKPAEAYALRDGNQVLLEFLVDDSVFFRHPMVRAAIAREGRYRAREGKLAVLALPLQQGGVLVVGPAQALPDLPPPAKS